MPRKDDTEIAKAAARKAWRTAIRLKHSLRADDEIARTLPDLEDAMDDAIAAGKPFELDVRSVFDEDKK